MAVLPAARTPRRRRPTERGYTLVEVVVALLMSTIIVTSVFSVALTTKQSGGKGERRLAAAQAARGLTSMLKNYVTGCACNVTCSAASCTMPGPNNLNSGVATWYLHSPPAIRDSQGAVYALAPGLHSIRGLLPGWFENAPYNARVNYTVDNSVVVNGRPVPNVSVSVDWTEP